jgi:Aspartyl protease
MSGIRTTTILAMMAVASQLGAQHPLPAEASAAQKIDLPPGGTTVPMGDFGGRPIVDVSINGKGPYRFILDTGSSMTVIGDDLKDELALPSAASNAHTPDGASAPLARIGNLRVGEASLTSVVVDVAPLSRMFRGEAARGVLSASSFPGYLVILDYPAKRVRIRKGELPPADSRAIFQYTAEQILPNVPVKIGNVEVRAHPDTGSPSGLTLGTKYMRELTLASTPVEVGRARTPGGEFPVHSAKVESTVELGQYKLDVTEIRFSDINPIPGEPTGNIGYQILRGFIVTLDSKNRRIRFDR